ncbi:unnamed protein product [Dicrocoelium dendriticum]|nr:unnamed protein product [Dicrocoelium dendriticum]
MLDTINFHVLVSSATERIAACVQQCLGKNTSQLKLLLHSPDITEEIRSVDGRLKQLNVLLERRCEVGNKYVELLQDQITEKQLQLLETRKAMEASCRKLQEIEQNFNDERVEWTKKLNEAVKNSEVG